ncbi:MmcQ/YjbR family DNA-binding protein [Cardiobacterium valvarum]|uniref:Uncharacterized protein n=1 Tax=Cardiobacterium valvarum F0432 TaxID=797473 RepID=G9ZBC9_9GAMM|nr:MmcQ/YjbR family DNA-binding protein [Cardiobacterium valvarum]EHM56146.1 hypothetical protein HMPREF9080_00052 [Cardiobacterium valvarum F0432]
MHRAELLQTISDRYGVAAEYPWRRYPQYAVFRHAGNRKWFAVLMNPPGRKLGLATEDEVAILNVKIRAGENSLLRGMDGVLPAYHMNKETRNTGSACVSICCLMTRCWICWQTVMT